MFCFRCGSGDPGRRGGFGRIGTCVVLSFGPAGGGGGCHRWGCGGRVGVLGGVVGILRRLGVAINVHGLSHVGVVLSSVASVG